MKVDTPVATIGIRGTAVLVEIDFEIPLALPTPGPPRPPTARFHVLVEPDGTTGSYTLFEKNTLIPIATVNLAGQQVKMSQGVVSITTAPLSAEVQKLITDVFALKFTSISPKSEFAFGSSVNNLADIGPLSKTAGDTVFDLTMPGIGKGTASTASITDSAAEMLFFLHATASNVSTLIEDSVALNLTLSGGGTVIFPGLIDIQGATIALKSSTSNAHPPGFTDNISQIGTFSVGGITTDIINNTTAVGWSFTLPDSNPVLQSLAMGQILTQVYTITLNSGATQDVTVTLVGVNDIPTIVSSSNSTPTLTEDAVAANLNLSAVGTITFRDVDLIDTHHATVTLKSSTSSAHLPGYTDNVSQIGTFALTSGPSGVNEVTTDTDNTGTVGWSFTLPDNDPVLQSLAEGQTITQIYTVTITDNNGALVTKDVTVTLVGTNDTPVITAATNGAVTEDATTPNLSTTGTITFADVDKIDTHSVSAVADAGNTLGGTLTPVVTTDATGGVAGTVTWTYTVANNATDNLAVGQTATEKFTVTVSDGHGGTASQLVTITINGTNEAPTISAHTDGAVTEDATTPNLSTTGTITFADVDKIDTHSVSAVADAGNTLGGTLTPVVTTDATGGVAGTVTWTYTVADNATDYLAVGQTATEKFTVTVSDGHGGTASQLVTITINGTNEAPTISAHTDGAVTEDATTPNLSTTGTITFADVDKIDTHSVSAVADAGNTLGGTLTPVVTTDATGGVAGTVTWTYTVANNATDYLAVGQTATEKFTVTVSDGHGGTASQLVTITINGTNEAPTISAHTDGAVTEDATTPNLSTTGTITFADVDKIDTHSVSAVADAGNTLG